MALLLNIDTALETASLCLAKDGETIQLMINENQKDHAGWLQPAVAAIFEKSGHTINELEAVAVTIGPGSYTGLRVGLASAKGFCYALNIPLITISTLEIIAAAVKEEAKELGVDLICPMVDARRMEVFTNIYDKNIIEQKPPEALILDENSFFAMLASNKVLFCGAGSKKLQKMLNNLNALFNTSSYNASHLQQISQHHFLNREFSDVAYTEPLYIKEFYTGSTRLS